MDWIRCCQSSEIEVAAARAAALARGLAGAWSSARVASRQACQWSPLASLFSLFSASLAGPAQPAAIVSASRAGAIRRIMGSPSGTDELSAGSGPGLTGIRRPRCGAARALLERAGEDRVPARERGLGTQVHVHQPERGEERQDRARRGRIGGEVEIGERELEYEQRLGLVEELRLA